MDYIDKIVFRMFKTLTDEQKYDLLEKLTLENKELKEQLNSSGVVKPLKVKKNLRFQIGWKYITKTEVVLKITKKKNQKLL